MTERVLMGPGGATELKQDDVLSSLSTILAELQQKLEAGGEVALDAATLAALESITATIDNWPTDFPDAAVHASVEALRGLVASKDFSTEGTLQSILTELAEKLETGGPVTLQVAGSDVSTSNRLPVRAQLADETNSPYTASNRVPVDVGSNINIDNLNVTFESVESIVNIPSAPLGADEQFIGEWEFVRDYASIAIALYTDASSTYDGASVQFSKDGITVLREVKSTIFGGYKSYFEIPPETPYFRVAYQNGPVAQTFLHASILFRFNPPGSVSAPLASPSDDRTSAAQVRSFLMGRDSTGTGAWSPLKATAGVLNTTDGQATTLLTGLLAELEQKLEAGGPVDVTFPDVQPTRDNPVTPTSTSISAVVVDQPLITPSAGRRLLLRRFHLHMNPEASSGQFNTVTLKVGATVVFVDKFEPGLPYAEGVVVLGEVDEPITISTSHASTIFVNLRTEEIN